MKQLTSSTNQLPAVPAASGVFAHASTGAVNDHAAEQAILQPEILRSLKMHRILALSIALAGALFALYYFHRLWPIYQAQALVYVQPASNGVADAGQKQWPYDNESYETYLQQQITNVTRRDVLLAALHKLGPGPWISPGESEQDAADRLSHSVEVVRNGSYQFFIGVSTHNADQAAQLANAITHSYIESTARDQNSGNEQRLTVLHEERDRIQAELAADQAEQDALNKQLGVASVSANNQTPIDEDINRTHAVLVQARTAHDEAEAKLAALNASSATLDSEADDIVANDPGLTSLKTSLYQRKAALVSQMANLTPNHPLYKQDQVELDKINNSIDQMTHELRSRASGRIQQKLRADLQRTSAVEDQVNSQLRQLVGTASSASSKLQRSSDLSSDIARLHERYGKIDSQLHDVQLDAGSPSAVVLIAAAVPPTHPKRSGVLRNTFFVFFASLLFAVAAAVVRHKLDPRIYTASDVRQVLGVTPVAQLPDMQQVSEAVFDEHLLRLAGALEQARMQTGMKNLVLTGTDTGVGVTTLASRLRSMLHASPLSANVAQDAAASDSAQLQVSDSAPLRASADAEYLARFSDCTLVVLSSGVTTRSQLRSTAEALKQLNISAVGFVLNRIPLRVADSEFRNTVRDSERLIQQQGRERHSLGQEFSLRQTPVAASELAAAPAPQLNEPLPEAAAPAVAEETQPTPSSLPDQQQTAPAVAPIPEAPAPQALPLPAAATPQIAAQQSPVQKPPRQNPIAQQFVAQQSLARPDQQETILPEQEQLATWNAQQENLRTLLFEAGLKRQRKTGPTPASNEEAPPATASAPKAAPPVQPVRRKPQNPAPIPPHVREVLATPEILPPREYIPVRDEDSESEDSARRDRRAAFDDVQILPSIRGQYRKKT
ncbi:hypothetical protein ACOBR2_14240 [Telmatobacter bradus]|uniref:GumC family protein n=1 Tax=Telmatobacter bradus TaxID=474953 RepID=UPI003B42B8FD